MTQTKAAALLIAAFAVACQSGTPSRSDSEAKKKTKKQASGKTCARLVGGNDTSDFPATVLLASLVGANQYEFCSATFVGANVLITAGHCLHKPDPSVIRFVGVDANSQTVVQRYDAGIAPSNIIHHGPSFIGKDLDVNTEATREKDLAYLIFATDLAPAIIDVAPTRPAVGEVVDVVGFGNNVFAVASPTHQFRRQTGSNVIASFASNGIQSLGIKGQTNTTDPAAVLASFGDSGGALLYQDKIAGVTSMLAPLGGTDGGVLFVDLNSTVSKSLRQQAEAAGAKVGVEPPPSVVSPSPAADEPDDDDQVDTDNAQDQPDEPDEDDATGDPADDDSCE